MIKSILIIPGKNSVLMHPREETRAVTYFLKTTISCFKNVVKTSLFLTFDIVINNFLATFLYTSNISILYFIYLFLLFFLFIYYCLIDDIKVSCRHFFYIIYNKIWYKNILISVVFKIFYAVFNNKFLRHK